MRKKITVALALVGAIFMLGSGNAYAQERLGSVNMINNIRIENGLNPLTIDESLANCAEIRAQEAGEKWSHTRPNGEEWFTVDDKSYGENLAKGFSNDAEMFDAWLQSPTHKANILNDKFRTIYISDNGSGYVACEFGI